MFHQEFYFMITLEGSVESYSLSLNLKHILQHNFFPFNPTTKSLLTPRVKLTIIKAKYQVLTTHFLVLRMSLLSLF
jgi:hypothetical protein